MVHKKDNSEFIFSKEGVAQGDPLSMLMYEATLMPLPCQLQDVVKIGTQMTSVLTTGI